jgi:drug/metabolite transporter (DMT)-like permease
MNKILSIVLLVVGIVLIVYGINASNSAASGVYRAFTGTPTDKTVWLLVIGIVLGLVGLFGMFRGPRTPIT